MLYTAHLQSSLHTTTPEGQKDLICQDVEATVALREDGSWSVRFRESDNGGRTTLQGTKTWMSITREGEIKSHLLFREHQRLESIYKTPQGEFEMATESTQYQSSVDAEGGHILLHYDLYLSAELAAKNLLEVKWKRI